MSRGWVVGSAEFKARLREELAEKGTGKERFELLGADRTAQREARALLWEERLRVAAEALDVTLESLPGQKSAADKVRLAAVMKAGTSVSNGWLAERLAMGAAGSVSQYVRRFRLRGGAEARGFKAALSKVHT